MFASFVMSIYYSDVLKTINAKISWWTVFMWLIFMVMTLAVCNTISGHLNDKSSDRIVSRSLIKQQSSDYPGS